MTFYTQVLPKVSSTKTNEAKIVIKPYAVSLKQFEYRIAICQFTKRQKRPLEKLKSCAFRWESAKLLLKVSETEQLDDSPTPFPQSSCIF